jgi:transcriptional regulator with XRE-family HTH domain
MGNDKISNIGKRIQAFRRDRDLTQDELAARLCITAQAISKWERGVGLPDVTIIPNLADALGVTVGALFGEEEQQSNNNEESESFDPDPINKIIKEADDDEYDELDEIDEVDEIDDTAPSGKSAFEKELSGFDSIDLSVAFPCRTNVIVSKDGFEGVKAIGSRRFISHLSVDMADNTLCVKASSLKNWTFKENQNKNSLTLYISPSCKKSVRASMAGSSSINVYADFDKASLSVSGSGNIKAQNCKTLKSIIAGSGCIELSNVSASSEISISGSGDLDAKSLGNNSSIKIAGSGSVSADAGSNVTSVITGSGDITVKSVSGDLSCNITGSGDFTCGGSVDSLSVRITGSGNFQGERLTANEAYVDITGSGDATVHRIIKNSTERLSKSASLTVMHRGEEA